MKAAMAVALGWTRIRKNPVVKVKQPKSEQKTKRIPSRREFHNSLSTIKVN